MNWHAFISEIPNGAHALWVIGAVQVPNLGAHAFLVKGTGSAPSITARHVDVVIMQSPGQHPQVMGDAPVRYFEELAPDSAELINRVTVAHAGKVIVTVRVQDTP